MLKPVALGVAALVICFFGGSAGAAALASASMNIVDFVWKIASDPTGKPSPGDEVLAFTPNASSDSLNANVVLDDKDIGQGGTRDASGLDTSVSFGATCTEVDCTRGPDSPPAADQFAFGEVTLSDFYATAPSASTPQTAALNADVSVVSVDSGSSSNAIALSQWISATNFTAQRSVNTYFQIKFDSLAHAQLDASLSSGSANAFTSFTVSVDGKAWQPSELNLSVNTLVPGDPSSIEFSDVVRDSYTAIGILPLVSGQVYTATVVALIRVDGNSVGPTLVTSPPIVWLFSIGLAVLIAGRRISGLGTLR